MDRENFLQLANTVINLKNDVKDINEDIKDRIDTAAEDFGVDKKILRRAVSEYEKYQKDRAKYIAEDGEVENILNKVINPETSNTEEIQGV